MAYSYNEALTPPWQVVTDAGCACLLEVPKYQVQAKQWREGERMAILQYYLIKIPKLS